MLFSVSKSSFILHKLDWRFVTVANTMDIVYCSWDIAHYVYDGKGPFGSCDI